MCMKNPSHPGKVLRIAFLEPLGLGVVEGAKVLGVSKQTLLSLVNGDSSMSVGYGYSVGKGLLRSHNRNLVTSAVQLRYCSGSGA